MVAEVTRAVKARVKLPVIVKLTPNVANIQEIAKAAEAAGANALTAINTALGMAIDVDAAAPILGGVYGGLSGPAPHPLAVRTVYQVKSAGTLSLIRVEGIHTCSGA